MTCQDAPDPRDRRTYTLELSVRSFNCLENEGIRTVGELALKTERELLRVPNLGRKSLNEIREALASFGLALAAETPLSPPKREPLVLTDEVREQAQVPLGVLRARFRDLKALAEQRGLHINEDIAAIGELLEDRA